MSAKTICVVAATINCRKHLVECSALRSEYEKFNKIILNNFSFITLINVRWRKFCWRIIFLKCSGFFPVKFMHFFPRNFLISRKFCIFSRNRWKRKFEPKKISRIFREQKMWKMRYFRCNNLQIDLTFSLETLVSIHCFHGGSRIAHPGLHHKLRRHCFQQRHIQTYQKFLR